MVHVATSYTNTCVQQSNVNTITQHAYVASCVCCSWYLVMIIAYDWPFAGLAWDTRGLWKFHILSFKNTTLRKNVNVVSLTWMAQIYEIVWVIIGWYFSGEIFNKHTICYHRNSDHHDIFLLWCWQILLWCWQIVLECSTINPLYIFYA